MKRFELTDDDFPPQRIWPGHKVVSVVVSDQFLMDAKTNFDGIRLVLRCADGTTRIESIRFTYTTPETKALAEKALRRGPAR